MNLCEKNNNPCNLRTGGKKFVGEIGENKGFRVFDYMRNGYRAAFITLMTYRKNKFDTIKKIINRWAPPNENNTKDYVEFVSKKTGIDSNLKLSTPTQYYWVVRAIALMEGMPKNDHDAVTIAFSQIYETIEKQLKK